MGSPGFFAEAAIQTASAHYRESTHGVVASERVFTSMTDTGRGGGGDDMEWVDCGDKGNSVC